MIWTVQKEEASNLMNRSTFRKLELIISEKVLRASAHRRTWNKGSTSLRAILLIFVEIVLDWMTVNLEILLFVGYPVHVLLFKAIAEYEIWGIRTECNIDFRVKLKLRRLVEWETERLEGHKNQSMDTLRPTYIVLKNWYCWHQMQTEGIWTFIF